VSSKREAWCSLGFGRHGGGEKFPHVQPKLKELSPENNLMELHEGFSLLTSYSTSPGEEYITSPTMQLPS